MCNSIGLDFRRKTKRRRGSRVSFILYMRRVSIRHLWAAGWAGGHFGHVGIFVCMCISAVISEKVRLVKVKGFLIMYFLNLVIFRAMGLISVSR
jgi:hypothetical protein